MFSDVVKLIDEPAEQVGAVLMLLAGVGFLVDAFVVDWAADPELFWSVATAGAGIYGAKAIVLLKQVRQKLEPPADKGLKDGE